MINHRKTLRAVACALALTLLVGCTPPGAQVAAKDPIAITVWHYYNGAQQQIFSQLVEEFNQSVGQQENIVVQGSSFGRVGDFTQKVEDAIYEKVGAEEVPDVFAAYADTAYALNEAGKVADIAPYMTEEEIAAFVPAYMEEGHLDEHGFKIFPIAKSTELLTLNKTE